MDRKPLHGPNRGPSLNPKQSAALIFGALLLYGWITALISRQWMWLGILFALAGAFVLGIITVRQYMALMTVNRNLDRACRTRLLEKYLGGDIPPEGDLTDAMPGVESEYFAVAMMQCIDFSGYLPECGAEHIPHSEFLQVDEWMREFITNRLSGISRPYYVPMVDGMEVLINVTGLVEDDLDQSSRRKLQEICGAIGEATRDLEQVGLICGAVVSTVYCGRENIVKARQEAQELTAYAELMGDSSPVKNGYAYAENPVELSDKLLRTELEKRFMQSVTNRNLDQLEKTMDSFVDLELRTNSRYPDLLKNRLIMHMEQMLSAFSISVADYGAEEAEVVAQFRLLVDMTSAQQLKAQCGVLIQTLRAYEESEQRQKSDKVARALNFIQEHFDDPGICAEMIGDALGVSASYVSRMLRQNTGLGVVDHIHGERLKRAKELLATTELSLDEVAQQVGFSSRFTLTRSFKRYEEMTPGAWREHCQGTVGETEV